MSDFFNSFKFFQFLLMLSFLLFCPTNSGKAAGLRDKCPSLYRLLDLIRAHPPKPSLSSQSEGDFFKRVTGSNRAMSQTERQAIALRYADTILANIQPLNGELTRTLLDTLPAGTYRLEKAPDARLLATLHDFRNSLGEVGFVSFRGKWLMQISHSSHVSYAEPLDSLLRNRGALQVDLHSHPGLDRNAEFPSLEDLTYAFGVHDRVLYIATPTGLLQVQAPAKWEGPGKLWNDWVLRNKLTKDDAPDGTWPLFERFLTEVYALRRIPWSKTEEINDLLRRRTQNSPARTLNAADP